MVLVQCAVCSVQQHPFWYTSNYNISPSLLWETSLTFFGSGGGGGSDTAKNWFGKDCVCKQPIKMYQRQLPTQHQDGPRARAPIGVTCQLQSALYMWSLFFRGGGGYEHVFCLLLWWQKPKTFWRAFSRKKIRTIIYRKKNVCCKYESKNCALTHWLMSSLEVFVCQWLSRVFFHSVWKIKVTERRKYQSMIGKRALRWCEMVLILVPWFWHWKPSFRRVSTISTWRNKPCMRHLK